MAIRFVPDPDRPSAVIEISLERPLPDYDLEEVEFPTPRDVDGVLVTQGFRDLVDDARGVLTELLARPSPAMVSMGSMDLNLQNPNSTALEIVQLTGAICPGDEVFRPGLWIILRDPQAPANGPLPAGVRDHLGQVAQMLASRLQLA